MWKEKQVTLPKVYLFEPKCVFAAGGFLWVLAGFPWGWGGCGWDG